MNPVESYRFCEPCGTIRKFTLNNNIGHSECSECGCRAHLKIHVALDFLENRKKKTQNEISRLSKELNEIERVKSILEYHRRFVGKNAKCLQHYQKVKDGVKPEEMPEMKS